MRSFLMICVFLATRYVAADVAHLNLRYLPPTMMKHAGNGHFYTRMHGNHDSNGDGNGDSKTTTTIEKQILQELPEQIEYAQPAQFGDAGVMMMMTMMHDDMVMPMPAEEMLPPPVDASPVMYYLMPKQSIQKMVTKMPAGKYFPPLHQMQHEAVPPLPEMPEIEQQQMLEFLGVEPEPAPAHRLTPNGYQYKTSSSFPAPMAMTRRFRLRH